jgi:hypothetical protein
VPDRNPPTGTCPDRVGRPRCSDRSADLPIDQSGAEVVGSLHYGVVGPHGRTRVLDTWLIALRDASLVGRVVDLLGGAPTNIHDSGLAPCVITDAPDLDILLSGPEDLDVGWHGQPGQVCDGSSQHDRRGRHPCACPLDLADRKAATRVGRGCRPRVRLCFRFPEDPGLGTFRFSSGNWALATQASNALASLRRDPRPTSARLSLERTSHRLRSGTTITYTRPELALVRTGSFEAASAVRP